MGSINVYAQFIASKTGKTGLTVTVDAWTMLLGANTKTQIVTAGSAFEIGNGIYTFRLGNIDLSTLDVVATFSTSDGTVDQQVMPAVQVGWGQQANVTQWLGTAPAAPATAGVPIVNTKYLNNTAQTARDIGASVLLSAGTGTGQLDVTAGVVKANLVQILATALTETAGQIAAAFKQFFNIASPTGTVNLIPVVTTVTNAPPDTTASGNAAAVINNWGTNGVPLSRTQLFDNVSIDTILQRINAHCKGKNSAIRDNGSTFSVDTYAEDNSTVLYTQTFNKSPLDGRNV